jgi:hypothetical protein
MPSLNGHFRQAWPQTEGIFLPFIWQKLSWTDQPIVRYITGAVGLRMETARGSIDFGHDLMEVIRDAKDCLFLVCANSY